MPITLLVAAVVRANVLSLVYLLFFLIFGWMNPFEEVQRPVLSFSIQRHSLTYLGCVCT